MPSLDGRRLGSADVVFAFREDREGRVTASYEGGMVVRGALVGARDGAVVRAAYAELTSSGQQVSGVRVDRLEELPDGRLRLLTEAGPVLEELHGPRWVRARVARPVASLSDAAMFYGGLLQLPVDGPYPGTPYDVLFVALPGGTELELVVGGPAPAPGTAEDLLVLYLATSAAVEQVAARLAAAGVTPVGAGNPYWQRLGVTVLDQDGYRVVLTSPPGT